MAQLFRLNKLPEVGDTVFVYIIPDGAMQVWQRDGDGYTLTSHYQPATVMSIEDSGYHWTYDLLEVRLASGKHSIQIVGECYTETVELVEAK